MTQKEYQRKRDAIAMSEAPLEQRIRAIEELDELFKPDSVVVARTQFEESQPDLLKEDN
jgi:hypothetical protein